MATMHIVLFGPYTIVNCFTCDIQEILIKLRSQFLKTLQGTL